jgi:hypothetical protein
MESITNISLFLPSVPQNMDEKVLTELLQEQCHIGVIDYIEILEELCLYPETNYTAFVYFQSWYPTLGNKQLQEDLEQIGVIQIPITNGEQKYMYAFRNTYCIPQLKNNPKREEELEEKIEKEMMETMEIMGKESFDFVDASYATYLETELYHKSLEPISLQ